MKVFDRFSTKRYRTMAISLALAVLVGLLGVALLPRIEAYYIKRAQTEARSTLRLVTDGVDQAVRRLEAIPTLIASDPLMQRLLREPGNSGLVPFANEKLRLTALSLGASDIYVLDTAGTTIAASNYRSPTSFMGRNFSFRPYFQQAVSGEFARFHALGTTSDERGFFYAAPVLAGIEVLGVLAVKITVDDLETAWEESTHEILVADPNGIAFLSSNPTYRMRPLAPLTDGVRSMIARTRQFPIEQLTPIPFSASVVAAGAVEVKLGSFAQEESYLSLSAPLQLPGWHAIVLSPLDPVRRDALYALFVLGLVVFAAGLILAVVLLQRARVQERIRVAQSQRQILERMVRRRTADLDAANQSLRSEIVERKSAEARLRKTQKELVQAGKLAALGQMSAALSHEINQPLAAVKSYADNAAQYLQRNRLSEVADNILRISQMADRMAKISGHLRNFARQPGDKLRDVEIGEVVQEAVEIVAPQLRQTGVTLHLNPSPEPLWVKGGKLRLQQVIVNILSNAMDAVSAADPKEIYITWAAEGDKVQISIRDTGHGIAPLVMDQVFDAFYTTKEAGSGMGLGMSISYNIVEDFGGKLAAQNHPDGGAVFTVVLRRAEPQAMQSNPMVAE